MADQDSKKINFAGLSDNLLIALVPLAGTYLAFVFQFSYFRFYGIPSSLIELDIPKIVFSISAIIGAAFFYSMLLNSLASLTSSTNPVLNILGRQLIVLIFILPLLLGLSAIGQWQTLLYGVFLLAVALSRYIPPRNRAGENLPYLERLRRREETPVRTEVRISTARSRFEDRVIAPVVLVMFGSIYVLILGFVSAGVASKHHVLVSQPDAIYVTKSHDHFVFVKYDAKTHRLKSQLIFLPGDASVELRSVWTGLLLPAR